METKKQLRTKVLQIRDALTSAERHSYSEKILQQVLSTEEYEKAETLLVFVSFRSEVNTLPLIEHALTDRKKVYVPKIEEVVQNDGAREKKMEFYEIFSTGELHNGYWGIPEPKPERERRFSISGRGEHNLSEVKILILLPGAVFDKKGNRIGYGGGFYDRYIHQKARGNEESENRIYKIALAFECQMVDSGMIPVEPHDIQVDAIVTELGIQKCE